VSLGSAEQRRTVRHGDSAAAYGNTGVEVLGTPALVGFIEDVALAAMAHALQPGQHTVGTAVDIEHLAPTPIGAEVTVHAEITAWEGRRVDFRVRACDAHEEIARGRHTRYVVDGDRFARRVARKGG
jgi:predicted thioesterase